VQKFAPLAFYLYTFLILGRMLCRQNRFDPLVLLFGPIQRKRFEI
jgi:hypothetical protein